MQLSALLAGLGGLPKVTGSGRLTIDDVEVSGISADSRRVSSGALFVAYRGVSLDSHRFIPDAIIRGAAAVVGEAPLASPLPIPYIQVPDGRAALGQLMAAWYGYPGREMALVGVTGTDGKTTTANLIYEMLQAAGRRAGLISTVNAIIGQAAYDTGLHTTTPDAGDVQRYLAEMRDAGTEVAVLEATSEGLAQQRLAGCPFDVAVVTNITHEHLYYHGTYEAYREAKALLFHSLTQNPPKSLAMLPSLRKTAVLNRDDSSYPFLAGIPADKVITYGLHGRTGNHSDRPGSSDWIHLGAGNVSHHAGHTTFDLVISVDSGQSSEKQAERVRIETALPGDFNVYNILAAAGAALALGLPAEAIQNGVRMLPGVPGRMERIDAGQDFLALVDFAHTPNALLQALTTARRLAASGGRIIAVFGCAGLRDRAKRAMMGQVAANHADYTVITAEDPRTEDLAAVMAATAAACATAGRTEGRDFVCVPDRQRAILHAVQQARRGDVVIVCGKGHEQSMCFGATEHPWRDLEALRWALGRLEGEGPEEPPFVLPTWSGS